MSNVFLKFKKELKLRYDINIYKFYSISQLSKYIFLEKFFSLENSKNLDIGNKEYLLNKGFRKYYFGGLSGLFKNYGTDLYIYDINSLFPFCMLQELPVHYLRSYNKIKDQNKALNLFGFFECIIEIPDSEKYPIVPYKNSKNLYVSYITGKIKGIYFCKEVHNFIKRGYKVKIKTVYEFSKEKNLFTSYVKSFYDLKKNPSELRFFYKLMLNSLYGKLSQKDNLQYFKIISKHDIMISELDPNFLGKLPFYGRNDLFLSIFKYHKKDVFLNLAIAMAITSYARIFMSPYFKEGLYYSDTDSIIVDKPLSDELVNDKIGGFKLEAKIKKFICLKNKIYGYINSNNEFILKFAGLSKDNKIVFEDLENILINNKIKYINYYNFYRKNFETYDLFFKEKRKMKLYFKKKDLLKERNYIFTTKNTNKNNNSNSNTNTNSNSNIIIDSFPIKDKNIKNI